MWLLAFRRLALRALPIWMQPATHTRSPLHIRQDPSSLFRKSPGFRGRLEAIRGYNAFVPRLSTSDNPGKAIPGCLSSPAESFDRSVDAPLACLVDHLDRFAEIFERRIDDRTRARMEIDSRLARRFLLEITRGGFESRGEDRRRNRDYLAAITRELVPRGFYVVCCVYVSFEKF